MRRISTVTVSICLLLFFIFLVFVLLTREYEVKRLENGSAKIKTFKNPVTENVRVVDTESGRTLFWYNEDGPIQAVKVENSGKQQWIVTIANIDNNFNK